MEVFQAADLQVFVLNVFAITLIRFLMGF